MYREPIKTLMNREHKYYVYILKCADSTYYTGITNTIERRIKEHLCGDDKNSYTYTRRPVELVFFTVFSNVEVAIEKEKQIKKWSQAKKEALIQGNYDMLPNLAKKKFKTV